MDGRYQMEMRVGEGGMAYVYRAKDRETGRTVAVKVLMSRLTGWLNDPKSGTIAPQPDPARKVAPMHRGVSAVGAGNR